ncbi:MAG: hypothetical protein AB8E74_04910 [Prochlorococcus sp.]
MSSRFPPQFLRRILLFDVVLALVCIGLSLINEAQLWSVFWGISALGLVLNGLVVRILEDKYEEEA